MPRPKRTKVASGTSRVATTSTVDSTPRKQIARKTQRKKSAEVINSFSDDSDGLVVKTTRPRNQSKTLGGMPLENYNEADLTLSGALPVDTDVSVSSSKSRGASKNISRKTSLRRSGAKESPAVSVHDELRRSISDAQQPPEEGDSSGFDNLLTFTSLDLESPAHGTRPPSAIKVGATPAHEASLLAIKNFKPRQRQPSLLRAVHQTTDMEDNDDSIGNLDNFDDFHPDAESTPLQVRKKVSDGIPANVAGLNLSSSSSRGKKRKLSSAPHAPHQHSRHSSPSAVHSRESSSTDEIERQSSLATHPRESSENIATSRPSAEQVEPLSVVQVPRSSPPYDPLSETDRDGSRPSSPSLPEVIQSTEDSARRKYEHEIYSETMAPPRSSSSSVEEAETCSKSPTRQRRRVRPKNVEADGEETETPAEKGRQAKSKVPEMSTARLKDLLPRRRTQIAQEQDEYDVQRSDDIIPIQSDEDELQLPSHRLAQSRKSAAPRTAKKKSRRGGKRGAGQANNAKTYSRRKSSDKENHEDEDEGFEDSGNSVEGSIERSPNTTNPSKLKVIKKKFEEIDAFEMDFESVDAATNSSPWR